jgi:hypothetical protein
MRYLHIGGKEDEKILCYKDETCRCLRLKETLQEFQLH